MVLSECGKRKLIEVHAIVPSFVDGGHTFWQILCGILTLGLFGWDLRGTLKVVRHQFIFYNIMVFNTFIGSFQLGSMNTANVCLDMPGRLLPLTACGVA